MCQGQVKVKAKLLSFILVLLIKINRLSVVYTYWTVLT